jgi:hypothetical protein
LKYGDFSENFPKIFLDHVAWDFFFFLNSKMVNFFPKKITHWTPPSPLHPPKLKIFFGVLCGWGLKKIGAILKLPFLSFFPKIKIPTPSYLPTYLPTYLRTY